MLFTRVEVRAQVNEHGQDTVGRSQIDTASNPKSSKSIADQQLIKIKITDLPDAVLKKLKSDSYTDWIIQDAYRNIALRYYSVRLKKANRIVFYTFDSNGERIKD